MKRNVEIKAKLRGGKTQFLQRLQTLCTPEELQHVEKLNQSDTFYKCNQGRLKLRVQLQLQDDQDEKKQQHSELIWYDRPDAKGPKTSSYQRVEQLDETVAQKLDAALQQALGSLGQVRKQRLVYHVGQTRVHVDDVDTFPDDTFVELEVVLLEHQTAAQGQAIAEKLMAQLGINSADLLQGAYLDLGKGTASL